ncbi:hypothetical protein NU195Hw_Modified_184t1 [Hortaea werneckii]
MRSDIQAALLNIKQHIQQCDSSEAPKPIATLYPPCLRSNVLSCAIVPLSSAGQDIVPEMAFLVQYLHNSSIRGIINVMSRLIEEHGIPELQRIGILSQGKESETQEIAAVAKIYGITVYAATPDAGGLGESSGAKLHESSFGFNRLTLDLQQNAMAKHDAWKQAVPFPPRDHLDAIHGNGTIALGFQHELVNPTQDTSAQQSGNRPTPDFVIADMDDGLSLSGICMALAGTDAKVIGAAPSTGFWEKAARHHTTEQTQEQSYTHRYWEGYKAPLADIPWEVFTGPRNLHGVLEVDDDQMYAASVAAQNQYSLQLDPIEAVPLAAALYNQDLRRHVLKAGGGTTSLTIGIVLKSRR